MNQKISIIVVDYQKDFCYPTGWFYKPRPCQSFLDSTFFKFLEQNKIKIAEIISDYRLPRPNETISYCIPGKEGYRSMVPYTIKKFPIWIKAMNSPEWIRENGGDAYLSPGEPYQDSKKFTAWLKNTIGEPSPDHEVVLIGLTLDCCVLATAQQLYYSGYKVLILKEGVDIYDPKALMLLVKNPDDYQKVLFTSPLGMWSKPIEWKELKPRLIRQYSYEKDNQEQIRAKL